MTSTYFEGAKEIGKPANMTDEECMSAWAEQVFLPVESDDPKAPPAYRSMWVLHYMPNKEDVEAINAGRGLWLQIHSNRLYPHAVFTLDEKGNSNDPG